MLALVLALSLAAPQTTRISCEGYTLVFTSASGVPTEDDETLELEVDGQRFPVPFSKTMFLTPRARFTSPHLKCQAEAPSIEVRPGVVVLMLARTGRPHLDLINLALVDLKARKTLAVVETKYLLASGRTERAGQVEFAFMHREAQGGFDLRAVREWLPQDDSIDGAMEDWLAVRVTGNQLDVRWLRR